MKRLVPTPLRTTGLLAFAIAAACGACVVHVHMFENVRLEPATASASAPSDAGRMAGDAATWLVDWLAKRKASKE